MKGGTIFHDIETSVAVSPIQTPYIPQNLWMVSRCGWLKFCSFRKLLWIILVLDQTRYQSNQTVQQLIKDYLLQLFYSRLLTQQIWDFQFLYSFILIMILWDVGMAQYNHGTEVFKLASEHVSVEGWSAWLTVLLHLFDHHLHLHLHHLHLHHLHHLHLHRKRLLLQSSVCTDSWRSRPDTADTINQ